MSTEPTIDYHALADAQVNYYDNEADKLAATIPDDLKGHVSGLYKVPERGSMNGPERFAKAQKAVERAQSEVKRETEAKAARDQTWQRETRQREEHEARALLGLPTHGAGNELPPNWQEWVKFINGGGKASEFHRQRSQEKAAANKVAPVQTPLRAHPRFL